MCIAVWKQSGVKLPKKEVLRKCWNTNSQGAGFAHFDEKAEMWQVQKGHMSWKKFWRAFNHMQFQKTDAVIIHFRISTSGKRTHPDCTHPYPVSFEEDELNEHTYETECITMHNGVVGPGDGDLSDTQVAIRDHVSVLFPHIEERGVDIILGDLLKDDRCRWFIANKSEVYLYGDWVTSEKTAPGVCFSNKGYIPYIAPVRDTRGRFQQHGAGNHINNNAATNANGTPNPFHHGPCLDTRTTGSSSRGDSGRRPEIHKNTLLVELRDSESKDMFCTGDTEVWDWDLWEDESNFSESRDQTENRKFLTQAPSLVEVFNLVGEVDAIVDEHGDIVWADGEVQHPGTEPLRYDLDFEIKKQIVGEGADYEFDCPSCGNQVSVRKLSWNGECCFCYAEILSWEEMDWIDTDRDISSTGAKLKRVECPNCNETDNITDSPFNAGDTLCKVCGAVFTAGQDHAILYDMDVARDYATMKRAMGV